MIEWLKIQAENGDTYLVNMDNIVYISKDGIATRGYRGYEHLTIPLDVEELSRGLGAWKELSRDYIGDACAEDKEIK